MKKNSILYIDDATAQVTKAFEKQARIFGTDEFKLWREYKKEFPNATMTTKDIKKNPNKKSYKNLTYANMHLYIEVKIKAAGDDEDGKKLANALQELDNQIDLSKIESNPYRAVLKWFLKKYDHDKFNEFFAAEKAPEKSKSKQKAEDAAEADTKEETVAPENTAPAAVEETTSNAIPFGMAANF